MYNLESMSNLVCFDVKQKKPAIEYIYYDSIYIKSVNSKKQNCTLRGVTHMW